jgi:hypothetical protein
VTVCTTEPIAFTRCKRRKVPAQLSGDDITSDAGVLLLREVDRRLKLTKRIAEVIDDPRCGSKVRHSVVDMLRQRVYALALGYEDLNDHDTLRRDPVMQTAVERDRGLASCPTLSRFEHRAKPSMLWQISRILVDNFIAAHPQPPAQLILDFDATDDPVHGDQLGSFFHGYYDGYCFLPLYVFCGRKLLVAYLRPGNVDAAQHSWAILSLLVKRLRQAWPAVQIIFRGDGGICRHPMLCWCERHGVDYIVGLAGNSRLDQRSQLLQMMAAYSYERTGRKQRLFDDFRYATRSWKQRHRVIVKAEHTALGANPR